MGVTLARCSSESDLITKIIASVKDAIALIEEEVSDNGFSRDIKQPKPAPPCRGMEQCLEHLEAKLDFDCEETQIVGIVGMPGIGKTALAEMYFNKEKRRLFISKMFQEFRERPTDHDLVKTTLQNAQRDRQDAGNDKAKALVVLDDVTDKKQLDFLRINGEEFIIKGSKILITTRDKGLLDGLVDDTYVVPGLNDQEALELFTHHAFSDQDYPPAESFIKMSKEFVDYAGGNPRALVELGKEICGKSESRWKERLKSLPHHSNENIRRELKLHYEELTVPQKHAFLDIACFFISEEEDYVRILLDSYDTKSGEAAKEIKGLEDKFLISISGGRIEMHNLLRTLGKEFASSLENNLGESRLWKHEDAHEALCLAKHQESMEGSSKKDLKHPMEDLYGSDASEGFWKGKKETIVHYRALLRVLNEYRCSENQWNEAGSKVWYYAGQIELLDEIVKAEGKFDFAAALERLTAEHAEAEAEQAAVKVKVPDWNKFGEEWLDKSD